MTTPTCARLNSAEGRDQQDQQYPGPGRRFERPARMEALVIVALLVLFTLGGTIALATPRTHPVTAATTTLRDRRGDAPARIDLTKLVVQGQGTKLLVRVHLRDAPRGTDQGYKIWLDSDRTPKAPDYTMWWISQEYGSGRAKGWDLVTTPRRPYGVGRARLTVNPRLDSLTFSVPMSVLDEGTRSVRAAASSFTMDSDGRRKAVDHLTARLEFSRWVPVASA